jgi:hypothetical protein
MLGDTTGGAILQLHSRPDCCIRVFSTNLFEPDTVRLMTLQLVPNPSD